MKIDSTRRPSNASNKPATPPAGTPPIRSFSATEADATAASPADAWSVCPPFALGGLGPPSPSEDQAVPIDALLPFAVGAAITAYHDLDWGDQFALIDAGCAHVEFVSRGCQQALMFTLGGRAWILFRGSDQSFDWLLNFAVLPFFHPGFRLAWWILRGPVSRWAQHVRHETASCVLVGHSLGGAIATLAARSLRDDDTLPVEAVITLGAPRVGSARFAATYDATPATTDTGAQAPTLGERTLRLVNGADPVPTVPPVLLGFRHVGRSRPVAQLDTRIPAPLRLRVRDPITFRRPPLTAGAWLSRLQDGLATYGRSPFSQLTRICLWLGRSSLQHLRACYGAPLGEHLAFSAFRPLLPRLTAGDRFLRALDRVGLVLIAVLLLSPILGSFYLLIRTASEGAWLLLVFEILAIGVFVFSPPDPY